jgi:stage III sporulation protein AB
MLKLVGAIMVVVAAGLCGLKIAAGYAGRPKELRSLQAALQVLETEISYNASCLPEAFLEVGQRSRTTTALLFNTAAEELSGGKGLAAGEAWQKALEGYYQGTPLKPSDLAILRRLGNSLGRSDRADQIKHIKLTMEQLSNETTEADAEARRNVKLWSYLGFLGGLVVVLVLY